MLKSVIALALLANAALAEAAEPPCITQAEFRSVGLFLLPPLIEGAAGSCQAHLPANAYLLTGGRQLAASVARDGEAHRQAAIATLVRVGGGKIPEGVSGETMASLISDMARSELGKKMSAGDCREIDKAAELLAPLPPENLVGVIELLARLGMKNGKRSPFRFCDARTL